MAAIIVAGIAGPGWPGSRWGLSVAGAAVALAGGIVATLAARTLGSGLTPFPRPSMRGAIAERGPYRVVRHPMYSGGLLFFLGFSLSFSPAAFGLTIALAVVWALKARVEERFLGVANPTYDDYRERTRFRLVPYVY